MAQPPVPAPDEDTPPDQSRERDLARRSASPALSPWLVIGLILMAAAGVYVASALFL